MMFNKGACKVPNNSPIQTILVPNESLESRLQDGIAIVKKLAQSIDQSINQSIM